MHAPSYFLAHVLQHGSCPNYSKWFNSANFYERVCATDTCFESSDKTSGTAHADQNINTIKTKKSMPTIAEICADMQKAQLTYLTQTARFALNLKISQEQSIK